MTIKLNVKQASVHVKTVLSSRGNKSQHTSRAGNKWQVSRRRVELVKIDVTSFRTRQFRFVFFCVFCRPKWKFRVLVNVWINQITFDVGRSSTQNNLPSLSRNNIVIYFFLSERDHTEYLCWLFTTRKTIFHFHFGCCSSLSSSLCSSYETQFAQNTTHLTTRWLCGVRGFSWMNPPGILRMKTTEMCVLSSW